MRRFLFEADFYWKFAVFLPGIPSDNVIDAQRAACLTRSSQTRPIRSGNHERRNPPGVVQRSARRLDRFHRPPKRSHFILALWSADKTALRYSLLTHSGTECGSTDATPTCCAASDCRNLPRRNWSEGIPGRTGDASGGCLPRDAAIHGAGRGVSESVA